MDDERIVDALETCCWGIGEVLHNILTCSPSVLRAFGRERCHVRDECTNLKTKLSLISIHLEKSPDAGFDPEIQDQARCLLLILQRVCLVSVLLTLLFYYFQRTYDLMEPYKGSPSTILNPQPHQTCSFEDFAKFVSDENRERALCRSILGYMAAPLFVREVLTERCERLLATLQSEESELAVNRTEPDDHSRTHKALFSALCEYTLCKSCRLPRHNGTPGAWHPARLFLTDSIIDDDDRVHFDVITSSTNNEWWQDFCIKIPLMIGRKVCFTSDIDSTILSPSTRLKNFCQILRSNHGCRISLELQDGDLFETGADALRHRVSPGMGISLADVLGQYELSVRQKLSLAHSVALAFWQYYQSQLMHRAWTSHTIWFMPEPDLLDDSERLPLRTYIAFHPEATESAYDASEFIMMNSLIHRCPRIQYLAILLLEIGLGRAFRSRLLDTQVLQLNYDNAVASKYLQELKTATWENFIHKDIFTGAIEKCLKLDGLTGKDGKTDTSTCRDSRRRLIHEMVVSPLERLNKSFQRKNAQIDYLSARRPALVPEPDESRLPRTVPLPLGPLPTNNYAQDGMRDQTPRMRPANRWGFETAIICALTLEADAVGALFDHHWEEDKPFYGKALGDSNAYSTGVMGRHNVVLAHMSGMGKSIAATAAASCRMSFPNIKLAILVGVCGAVPIIPGTADKVYLGDVIVSDGVVEYDFGRQLPERFERKDTLLDSLGRPSPEIRSTLNKLKGIRGMRSMKTNMARYLRELGEDRDLEAIHPFPEDNPPKPKIHFGLIASGDTVMRSAEQRDDIAERENTIAFEMEGAAVWDTFPCLVIKGACDYADSHKTKDYQRYAAATAAACTKAFLDSWEPSNRSGYVH